MNSRSVVMQPEPWISLEEVAQHLGVSQDTIHRWIRNRKMPAHKVGRLWKFKVSQVDLWVQTDGANDPVAIRTIGRTSEQ